MATTGLTVLLHHHLPDAMLAVCRTLCFNFHPVKILLFLFSMLLAVPVVAQEHVVVGVVVDGPSDRFELQHQIYIDELLALTSSEFDVEIRRFSGEWSKESIDAAISDAYTDREVDLVLVTGFVANQIAAIRPEFPKPTFLPIIIDVGLVAGEVSVGRSGKANLNYLTAFADFAGDLDTLARITPYKNLVLFIDTALSSAVLALRDAAYAASEARGINLLEILHDGIDHRLMNRVPADTDAIFIAGLPRMPPADFALLVEAINAAGLPSYGWRVCRTRGFHLPMSVRSTSRVR